MSEQTGPTSLQLWTSVTHPYYELVQARGRLTRMEEPTEEDLAANRVTNLEWALSEVIRTEEELADSKDTLAHIRDQCDEREQLAAELLSIAYVADWVSCSAEQILVIAGRLLAIGSEEVTQLYKAMLTEWEGSLDDLIGVCLQLMEGRS